MRVKPKQEKNGRSQPKPPGKTLHIEVWSAERPLLLAVFSQQIAVGTDAVCGMLKILQKRKQLEQFPSLPSPEKWLELHKDHWRIFDLFVDGFAPSDNPNLKTSQALRNLIRAYAELCRMTPDERRQMVAEIPPEELREIVDAVCLLMKGLAKFVPNEVRRDIAGSRSPQGEAIFHKLWPTPEMQYFLRVWAPCFIIHQDFPTRLMRRARQGNIDAICDLIRLDKAVIAEPRVALEIAKAHLNTNRAIVARIARALAATPKSLSQKKVKSLLAGLISKLASAIGQKLDAPEIRDLFDAINADYGRGTADPDIGTGETLTKNVQRNRDAWRIIPDPPIQPDKNLA